MDSLNVCVFCASSQRIGRKYLDLAANTGVELARRGHTLVSGGGRVGSMGAVARSARAGGAHTVGVIPRGLVGMEVADDDADELIVADDMRTRKAEMDRRADAFLVLPGGIGTLEELFEVWTAQVLGLHSKPLVVLDPYGLYGTLRELVSQLVDEGFAQPHVFDAAHWAATTEEAFDHLESAVVALRPGPEEMLEAEP